MYNTAHWNPCGVLVGFSCAHFTNSPTSHDTNTHWVNMCICMDLISHCHFPSHESIWYIWGIWTASCRIRQDKKLCHSVIWVQVPPRPLVRLHQQLKVPLLPGKTWWSSSMGHAVRDTKSLCTHCCVPASERFMKYLSGYGGWLAKWPKWTKEKEILEIRPECRIKGQLPHLEGGGGKKENVRQILESPRGCGTHQPSEGTFPRIFQAPDVTLFINHQEPPCPTLFLPSRSDRCRGIFGEGRTGDLITLGPSSGYQYSHWFSRRSDLPDWNQASNTNELCSFL